MAADNTNDKAMIAHSLGEQKASTAVMTKLFPLMKANIERGAKTHDFDYIMANTLLQIGKSFALQGCKANSVMRCVLQASQMGLVPNGRDCHLIPYKDTCTLIVDVKGLCDLIMRSGNVASISAHVVYDKEHFSYREGVKRTLDHTPLPPAKRGTEKIGVYSVVAYKDSSSDFYWMWYEECLHIRDATYNWQKAVKDGKERDTVWFKHEDEMLKKSALHRHSKTLRLTTEARDELNKVDDAEREPEKNLGPAVVVPGSTTDELDKEKNKERATLVPDPDPIAEGQIVDDVGLPDPPPENAQDPPKQDPLMKGDFLRPGDMIPGTGYFFTGVKSTGADKEVVLEEFVYKNTPAYRPHYLLNTGLGKAVPGVQVSGDPVKLIDLLSSMTGFVKIDRKRAVLVFDPLPPDPAQVPPPAKNDNQ